MNSSADWIDRNEYPFRSHFMTVEGGRMHYVDEGQGHPIVMVHGTPTWSFLYRNLIKELSNNYRCIAMDHIGFGISDKPRSWGYRPEDHARNLRSLIEQLELADITLVVHDFGGPIGLSYAIDRPGNVSSLVMMNTWLWSLGDDASVRRGAKVMSSPIGKFLYTRLNFSPRVMVRIAWGDKSKLTQKIHQHYIRALPTAQDRYSTWVLAREVIGSSAWYEGLWHQRDRFTDKPALLLWGMKDPAFGEPSLNRWREEMSKAQVITFPNAGHFLPEEEHLAQPIAQFLHENVSRQEPTPT